MDKKRAERAPLKRWNKKERALFKIEQANYSRTEANTQMYYEYDPDIDIYADQDEDEAEGLEDYFEGGADD